MKKVSTLGNIDEDAENMENAPAETPLDKEKKNLIRSLFRGSNDK
jgi:hypothetical protein